MKRHRPSKLQWKTNRKLSYLLAPILVTLHDVEGHSPLASFFRWYFHPRDAMARCLSVSVRHKSVFYRNAEQIELVFGMGASFHLSHTVLKEEIRVSP